MMENVNRGGVLRLLATVAITPVVGLFGDNLWRRGVAEAATSPAKEVFPCPYYVPMTAKVIRLQVDELHMPVIAGRNGNGDVVFRDMVVHPGEAVVTPYGEIMVFPKEEGV